MSVIGVDSGAKVEKRDAESGKIPYKLNEKKVLIQTKIKIIA